MTRSVPSLAKLKENPSTKRPVWTVMPLTTYPCLWNAGRLDMDEAPGQVLLESCWRGEASDSRKQLALLERIQDPNDGRLRYLDRGSFGQAPELLTAEWEEEFVRPQSGWRQASVDGGAEVLQGLLLPGRLNFLCQNPEVG